MTILRPIREEELEMIMQWRMSPEITKFMYTDPELTLEGQKKWYHSLQNREDMMSFMIEVDEIPSGILNITDIDHVNRRCSWGYYMAVKEKRSLKLALALEWNLYDYVFDVLGMHKLEGEIFSFNKPVLRLHQMCGSRVEGVKKDHILKHGQYYDVTITGILKQEWQEQKEKFDYEKIRFLTEI
jgi:hypothetical protein